MSIIDSLIERRESLKNQVEEYHSLIKTKEDELAALRAAVTRIGGAIAAMDEMIEEMRQEKQPDAE